MGVESITVVAAHGTQQKPTEKLLRYQSRQLLTGEADGIKLLVTRSSLNSSDLLRPSAFSSSAASTN